MDLKEYTEEYFTPSLRRHAVIRDKTYFSSNCLTTVQIGGQCPSCKYFRKSLLAGKSRVRRSVAKQTQPIAQKFKLLRQKNRRLSSRLNTVSEDLERLQKRAAALKEEVLEEKISNLPPRQQEAVRHCFSAAKVRSKGTRYSKKWVLECIIMKMKSPKLYEHLRKNQIMCLPSRSTLKRYLASYRSTFGFNSKVLRQLKAKTVGIDPFRRHGGIIIDELKLSEHLSVKQNGVIEGFVDLGQFSTPAQRHTVSDHGMVVLFVPFVGKWSQIIGSFATSGNMKAEVLAKVITEATILAENSGLFVDFVTCDGASWNRKMWKIMGIGGGATYVNCNVQHRVDSSRSLFFLSDFPHLIKCLRNSLLKNGFDTPDGLVTVEHVKEAYKIDASSLTLKAMTGITQRHLAPNNFEKMRVTYAFQLFGKKVLQGLHLYKAELEKKYGSVTATQTFFK
ncbi:uncharacterized protein LOC119454742 isoform X2 [Dermacentor silvarum]|nr:uncharacterized protein LOC119454742 isoform X2 [Dermacentor silvarum]